MKLIPATLFLGVAAATTALTTYVGVTPTIELQLLLFINVSVLTAILLRKYIDVSTWILPGQRSRTAVLERKPFSNTSWFVTNRLGLKKLTPEEECTKREMEEQEMEEGTGNGDIGEIVDPEGDKHPHGHECIQKTKIQGTDPKLHCSTRLKKFFGFFSNLVGIN